MKVGSDDYARRSAEFKRWLALYFIEKGNWRLTDKAIEEFGTDATPKQTMEFAEVHSDRERDERTEYRVGLTPKEKKRIAHMKIADMIDEGKSEELYDNEYIIQGKLSWKDKNFRLTAVKKLIEVLQKDPRNITVRDFNDNNLSSVCHYYNSSPYKILKKAFPELDIRPWEMKKTPNSFYADKENRIAAVRWLADKLGKDPRDITIKDFMDNNLSGLTQYYKSSSYKAVIEAFPEMDIKPWEMYCTPMGFYDTKKNRIAAVRWLADKLGKDPRNLTVNDFNSNRLSGLFGYYNSSPYKAVIEAFPEMDIKPWEMAMIPQRFYSIKEKRAAAVKWLVEKLGKDPRDLMQEDFRNNGLNGLLTDYYNSSPYKAVIEAFPDMNIKPLEMSHTPRMFYDTKENRVAAVKWLVEKLGKDPRDVLAEDFKGNNLSCLIHYYYKDSPYKALEETFPELSIKPWEVTRTPSGFYEKKENRAAAIKWLVDKLGKDPKEVTANDFRENRMASLLKNYYGNSPYEAVKEAGLVRESDEKHMRRFNGSRHNEFPSSKEAREAVRKLARNATKKKPAKTKQKLRR